MQLVIKVYLSFSCSNFGIVLYQRAGSAAEILTVLMAVRLNAVGPLGVAGVYSQVNQFRK